MSYDHDQLLARWNLATREWAVADDMCQRLLAARVDRKAIDVARAHRDELGRRADAAGEIYSAVLRAERRVANG